MANLIHEGLLQSASLSAEREALKDRSVSVNYGDLAQAVGGFAGACLSLGLNRHDRVAVWADKRLETVVAMYGASAAGCVFVPINPVLKAEQAAYILQDCNVRLLVTTAERWATLAGHTTACPDLQDVALMKGSAASASQPARHGHVGVHVFDELAGSDAGPGHRCIDTDMAAILYTSGSTGRPKGVVVSHRNMVAGVDSVTTYLGNHADDRLLAVLPLSFDYGLSQLSTAFAVGACAVLHNYLLAGDVLKALARERITGLAAVPPLWIQLASLEWPAAIGEHLRYFTNSGGAMPTATLAELRRRVPRAKPYLMYGLTEAFRSTYLPPEQVDVRPHSMGKAIPNAEILVLREDGTECAPGEPGELVHRGALVALGYWNDPEKTAERFKPVPGQRRELVMPEMAVWSGDTVRRDDEGFLYFVSRRDEMIKTSGYRVSPTEVEEVIYRTGLVAEVAALGVSHPVLGQAIVLVAQPASGQAADSAALLAACKEALPLYMVPHHIDWHDGALPRNANGKIDRKDLAGARASLFADKA